MELNMLPGFYVCYCKERPHYSGALAHAAVKDNCLMIIAHCEDGKTRTYKSTPITDVNKFDQDECIGIVTENKSHWCLFPVRHYSHLAANEAGDIVEPMYQIGKGFHGPLMHASAGK